MKVAVVGAGPAGMTAALAAAQNGNTVVLFEKNEKIGKKLYITGKGRCNVTNASDTDAIIKNVVTNPKFLYSSLRSFGSEDTMRLLEGVGVPLKIERGNRVFPVSDKSSDIIKAFDRLLSQYGVIVRLNEAVKCFSLSGDKISSMKTDKARYNDFDAYILATGGMSYSATGSTGDGYTFAEKMGHTIVPPKPSLVGVYLSEVGLSDRRVSFDSSYRGISLKNVELTAFVNGKKLTSEFGEALYTEKGLSGPIVLTLSSKLNRYLPETIELRLDMKPALTEEKLDERILRDIAASPNKDIKNFLRGLLPSGLVPLYLSVCGIPEDKKVNTLTKEERKRICLSLKELRLFISGLEPLDRAVVTSGGIDVREIRSTDMRSKKIENLSFAGEIIDVDALTGGYNIQIAITTGFAAGSKIES